MELLKKPVEPFPDGFPDIVLKRILDFLPWTDRIKYESVSRQFFHLLRPTHFCRLPLDTLIRVSVQQPQYNTDICRQKVQMLHCWGNTLVQIGVKSNDNGQLCDEMDRILSQVPTIHVEFTRLPTLGQGFFNALTSRTSRISQLWLSFSSIQALGYSRQFWKSVWEKLPLLEGVEIYSLKTDSECSLDDLLVDLIRSRPLERLIVNYCEPSITDQTVIELSKSCSKLSHMECFGGLNVTNKGVEELTRSLVHAPIHNGARRRMNFWRCNIDKDHFWKTFADLMDPVTLNEEGKLITADPTIHSIEDFANDRLFVSFD